MTKTHLVQGPAEGGGIIRVRRYHSENRTHWLRRIGGRALPSSPAAALDGDESCILVLCNEDGPLVRGTVSPGAYVPYWGPSTPEGEDRPVWAEFWVSEEDAQWILRVE